MSKKPPIPELDFLKHSGNHLELARRLTTLGFVQPDLIQYASFICTAWFKLGEEHLGEAEKMLTAGCSRGVFSRSYYAAYNISKAVRYQTSGFVSLKGDDHAKASTELPGDFPDVAKWSGEISNLYEHRLHADYDNWLDTASLIKLTPAASILIAKNFAAEAKKYLKTKPGIQL